MDACIISNDKKEKNIINLVQYSATTFLFILHFNKNLFQSSQRIFHNKLKKIYITEKGVG